MTPPTRYASSSRIVSLSASPWPRIGDQSRTTQCPTEFHPGRCIASAISDAVTDGVVCGGKLSGRWISTNLNLRVRDVAACRDCYERHFGFHLAFEAEGGYFERNGSGFLLALMPAERHQALPAGFHIGFGVGHAVEVAALRTTLEEAGVRMSELRDFRPNEQYVTFRCWDPDDTEIEVFWESP